MAAGRNSSHWPGCSRGLSREWRAWERTVLAGGRGQDKPPHQATLAHRIPGWEVLQSPPRDVRGLTRTSQEPRRLLSRSRSLSLSLVRCPVGFASFISSGSVSSGERCRRGARLSPRRGVSRVHLRWLSGQGLGRASGRGSPSGKERPAGKENSKDGGQAGEGRSLLGLSHIRMRVTSGREAPIPPKPS